MVCFQAAEDAAKPQSHTVNIQSLESEERNLKTEEEEDKDKEEDTSRTALNAAPVTVSSCLKYSLKHQ